MPLPTSPIRWRPWLLLWSLLLLTQLTLLANNAALDTLAFRTTRWLTGDKNTYHFLEDKTRHAADPAPPFYFRRTPPFTHLKNGSLEGFYKRTENFWRLFRDLAEPSLTFLLILAVSIYNPRRWKGGLILLVATALAAGFSTLLRLAAGRLRPEYFDGANQWQFLAGFRGATDLSWPSAHATLAFASAAALTYLSPKGRVLFITLAAACAVARIVTDAHFLSDVLLGSVLGWTVAWFAALFTARALDRLLAPPTSIPALP